MYDSLNKRFLSPYCQNTWVKTPNFWRLAERTAVFENFYAGSLPCMPARRELHTGRLNFLHRGWSPCEPFDESMPRILKQAGIYSHLITDHCHYWHDGGANYHNCFSSFEFIRGQEGDSWIPSVDAAKGGMNPRAADEANRKYMREEKDHYHVRCFEKGREFLLTNQDKDGWYLQLEYFDPHEPFFVPERFKRLYTDHPTEVDWPEYRPVESGDEEKIRQYRINYAALVTMCDEYLGKILDIFDEYDMWKDTVLIVNTDHGYFLGEKGFVGKNYPPVYDEIGNLPFFIHLPDMPEADGCQRKALAQTPDIPLTILKAFGVEPGQHMLGVPLQRAVKEDEPIHEAILYGYHGMHVNITDGKYTYMRAAQTEDNGPLYQYTLMPWHIMKPMESQEIINGGTRLYDGFAFTNHVPVLRIPVDERYDKKRYYRYSGHRKYGSLLFDRDKDPKQVRPLWDPCQEERMKTLMRRLMEENECPEEQYVRLGLDGGNRG